MTDSHIWTHWNISSVSLCTSASHHLESDWMTGGRDDRVVLCWKKSAPPSAHSTTSSWRMPKHTSWCLPLMLALDNHDHIRPMCVWRPRGMWVTDVDETRTITTTAKPPSISSQQDRYMSGRSVLSARNIHTNEKRRSVSNLHKERLSTATHVITPSVTSAPTPMFTCSTFSPHCFLPKVNKIAFGMGISITCI